MKIDDGLNNCDSKLSDLIDALNAQKEKGMLENQIQHLAEYLGEEMQQYEEVVQVEPEVVSNLIKVCLEMQKDTKPDKSADYFEEKSDIE